MMKLAPGMAAAIRASDGFASDAEAAAYWSEAAPRVPFEDKVYTGGAGQTQRARIYRGDPDAPTLLYVHGGGWCGGSIDLNEAATRGICAESGWNVVSVSYRLAPANPYPAGLEDCLAAWRWIEHDARDLGLSPGPIAIAGASAGANLAMAASLARREVSACGLVLFYGVFGCDTSTESYHSYADGPSLTRARMTEIFDLYDPGHMRETDHLITPLLAPDLGHLPPACIIAAEHDVLLDDSRQMADRLTKAGVAVDFRIEKGVTHGFINRGRLVPAAKASVSRAADFLKNMKNAG